MFWKKNARIKNRRFSSFVLGLACLFWVSFPLLQNKEMFLNLKASMRYILYVTTHASFSYIVKGNWKITQGQNREIEFIMWLKSGFLIVYIYCLHLSLYRQDLCNAKLCLGLYLQFRLKKSKEKEESFCLLISLLEVYISAAEIFILAFYLYFLCYCKCSYIFAC